MIYIIWLVLLSLFVFSFLVPKFPIWIPVLAYLLVVGVRVKEKYGNYLDWIEKNHRDEERAIDANLHDFEIKGLATSGMRLKQENHIKKDFEYERKKQKRQRDTELIDCLFIKK
ncbi:MAG: hypothetical protein PHW53_03775 [Patescibacteria group bacterium]|nr:hypothetical protein [Patescibacteria group bacterium]